MADRAGAAAVREAGAVRVGAVLQHEQAVLVGDPHDLAHVGHAAVQVDGDHADRPLGDRGRDRLRADGEGVRVDVDQDRHQVARQQRPGSRLPGRDRHDHLAADARLAHAELAPPLRQRREGGGDDARPVVVRDAGQPLLAGRLQLQELGGEGGRLPAERLGDATVERQLLGERDAAVGRRPAPSWPRPAARR